MLNIKNPLKLKQQNKSDILYPTGIVQMYKEFIYCQTIKPPPTKQLNALKVIFIISIDVLDS